MSESKYPEGVTDADHVAHDLRMGRFPEQSSVEQFLREREAPDGLRALGVGRDAGNEKALLVCFNRKPSDDEMRALHDLLSRFLAV